MAIPIGAIVGAAASLGGAIFGNRNRKREAKKSFERSKKMFDYQNAYNTPSMQMARLKQAGLNPALMYQQGNTGNASGYPQAPVAEVKDIGAGAAQSAAAGAQLSLLNSQKQLNEANALKAGIDGAARAGDYEIAKEMSKYQMSKLNAETQGVIKSTEYKALELKQAAETGMIKGDNIGNVARALGINIGTPEGKQEFKNTIYAMLGYNAAMKLAPSVLNILSKFGFTKGMSQGKFNQQADKWLNNPFKK
jgi:hypothetical protein